jgi:hypothetical protein
MLFSTGPFEPKNQKERNLNMAGKGFEFRFFDYG